MSQSRKPARRNASPGRKSDRREPVRREKADTSWEKSSGWYDRLVGESGSEYHREVIFEGALAMLGSVSGRKVLDAGCGQGAFSRVLKKKGAAVTGADASPSLIAQAKSYESGLRDKIDYRTLDAAKLDGLADGFFEAVTAILCIQNMRDLQAAAKEFARVLASGGRALLVLNHPCFRIPRQSSWGFEEGRKLQYRRVDAYMTPLEIPISMHPGRRDSETTLSFHRSLADIFSVMRSCGFVLVGLEEWCSHKKSQSGPRAKAEDRARREIPLFMGLLWQKS